MAAGQSSRFNGCKHLAKVNEHSLLELTFEALQHTGVNDVFIITGRWHKQIRDFLGEKNCKVQLLFNPNWQAGIGNSIALAVTKLAQDYDAILIALADQVAITQQDYQQLLDEFALQQKDIVCANYQQTRGVPAVFSKTTFAQLSKLDGDKGAKKLLYSSEFSIVDCPLESAAIDIDTQQQLDNFTKVL
ncbi:nucleotidyltransferase family protein [Catenovulum agarivorans]|uniref:nucleotidyltransferase family protein n=1 Tax=Catenovulum agarivorans TaxID=1172192 RepID=UPI0002FE0064|nr:nucleotidyltransferase family protein [Catenovulum agarivorans]